MAVESLNLVLSNTNTTLFRAWGSALSAAIAAVGLVKTSDSGTINWTSVSAPGSPVWSGFEIWKFADTLQSTTPMYMKYQYGAYNTAADPSLNFSFGTSTDGSGNLEGQLSEIFIWDLASHSDTISTSCIVAGATNRLQIGMCLNNQSSYSGFAPLFFSVERDKDTTGTDTSLGFFALTHAPNNGTNIAQRCQFIPQYGIGAPQASAAWSLINTHRTTGAFGANLGLFPVFPSLGYPLNPAIGGLLFYQTDLAANAEISLNMYGVAHSFWTIPSCNFDNSDGQGMGIAMRYE